MYNDDKEIQAAILLEKLGDLAKFSAKNPSLAEAVNAYRDRVLALYQGIVNASPKA